MAGDRLIRSWNRGIHDRWHADAGRVRYDMAWRPDIAGCGLRRCSVHERRFSIISIALFPVDGDRISIAITPGNWSALSSTQALASTVRDLPAQLRPHAGKLGAGLGGAECAGSLADQSGQMTHSRTGERDEMHHL